MKQTQLNTFWKLRLTVIVWSAVFLLSACQPGAGNQSTPSEIVAAQAPSATLLPTAHSSADPSLSAETATSTSQPSPTASDTPAPTASPTEDAGFSFVVNGDTAYHAGEGEFDTPQYFRGMAESIANLPDARFLVSVGDTDFPADTRWTLDRYLGEVFLWFPAVGNHELYPDAMDWLNAYPYDLNGDEEPNIVNHGPAGCENTTYSFDYQNVHIAVLNIYCDVDNQMRTDGAIVDHLYNWLKADLEATDREHIFVVGHEAAFAQPDEDASIVRWEGEGLDKYPVTRDRFWALLKEYGVVAYLHGHSHSYSITDIDGVWQIDTAHSMGARQQATRSTYVVIHVQGSSITYETYRADNITEQYELTHQGVLR